MDLSIIIVNWNSVDYLKKCIASILSETRNLEFEIIVIDSASYDGSEKMLRTYYPQVLFIQSESNLGFARSNNVAYKESTGQYVLFLNPDTELVGPAINTLYDWLHSLPVPGIIGCRLLNSNRSVQTSCIQSFPTILNQILDSEYLRKRWPRLSLWGMKALYGHDGQPEEVDAISGACMMLKRSVFEQVGVFSEDYFMYTEDVDLSYKVRQAGYLNYYTPDATIIHFGGGSSQKVPNNFSVVMMQESIWRFLRKTRGSLYAFWYRSVLLLSALCRVAALTAAFPLEYICHGGSQRSVSLGKWRTIIRWCLFKATLANKHT